MNQKHYYVYILTNKSNKVLYTGITSDLLRRGFQHKEKQDRSSFTAKYNVNKLVYFEEYRDVNDAIAREKQIKNLQRRKKVELIGKMNPGWKDLAEGLSK